jgi:hypothetical protein
MSLDDLMGTGTDVSSRPAPQTEPAPEPKPVDPPPAEPVAEPEPVAAAVAEPVEDEAPRKAGRRPVPDVFRTSLYFHRTVHDALREVAYDERLTISDLINEGIDLVLKGRGYPTAADLKAKGARKRKR